MRRIPGMKNLKMLKHLKLVLLIFSFASEAGFCPRINQQVIDKKETGQNDQNIKSKIESSMVAAALGDVLGGVSEFDKTPQQIFQRHPFGVYSINQFTQIDWSKFPDEYKKEGIAPYTDDTAMALLVADALVTVKEEDAEKNFNQIMNEIARSFIDDSFKSRGWMAQFRAPGMSTMNAIAQLNRNDLIGNSIAWDQSKTLQENGGCGSVMRAHPCGLHFRNNLEFAEKYAVGQSKITHAHPWALAACAAVGVGVALAIQSVDEKDIVNQMVQVAQKYDVSTAQKIKEAY